MPGRGLARRGTGERVRPQRPRGWGSRTPDADRGPAAGGRREPAPVGELEPPGCLEPAAGGGRVGVGFER